MRVSKSHQKLPPKLRITTPIDRMPLIRRDIGQRPEDEGIAQDLISREAIAIDLTGKLAVGQQVKVERAWRETLACSHACLLACSHACALICSLSCSLTFKLTTPLTAVLGFDAAQ